MGTQDMPAGIFSSLFNAKHAVHIFFGWPIVWESQEFEEWLGVNNEGQPVFHIAPFEVDRKL